jgi:TolB-like protein/Tfp pilus assembly protein PilF
MAEQRVQRRLAAILAADVVGFSRLMEQDETGTLAALKARRRDVVSPLIGKHQGRLVKVMGDGVLIEFASAVSAVQCAIDLQRDTATANETLPEDKRIVMRVGINLGDVIVEGSDLYGDGVNIAARLEALAEPGGICISAKVHDEVRGKIDATFADCGDQQLKNMEAPVRAWRWIDGSGTSAAAAPPRAASSKPSIAVLPFANMSDDNEQRFFSDGITEDIITELARFRQMHVLARNSSFRYRGIDLDMVRVGRELGVQYLLEGSVRRIGTRLRITAQLIDAKSGHHLWAEKFDRDQNDIFAVQDQVVRTIVTTLAGRVQAAGADIASRKAPASLAAYECVLRADALPLYDPAAGAEARLLYEKAIEIDPGYARAYALLAINIAVEWESDLEAPDSLLDRALELARKSVALDENDSACHSALGLVYLDRRSHDLAEHHYLKAVELNSNRASLIATLGLLYSYLGRPDEGIAYLREARSIDPFFEPSWYWTTLGAAHFIARQYDDAITALRRASEASPLTHALLAAANAHRGDDAEARRHAAELLRLAPNFSIAKSLTREPLKREADREHLVDGMRKAGLPE